MIDKEPSQEQQRELWEKCGFEYLAVNVPDGKGGWKPDSLHAGYYWKYPNGDESFNAPPIDLNNLERYAFPKLMNYDSKDNPHLYDIRFIPQIYGWAVDLTLTDFDKSLKEVWIHVEGKGKTLAVAVYWACYKAFGLGGKE